MECKILQFRKDINGLRAIAVISVVLFHFNANWIPGGFAGVDVFFVISGFLMTGIIFRGISDNSFSLLKFYKSRATRIIPALSAACLFAVIFSYFFLYDTEFKNTIGQAISAITFLSNFYFWKTSNYFSPGAETNFLLHTWSLSTEWQFYIIYPLTLFTLSKFVTEKRLRWVIFAGFIVSLIISIYASPKWATSSYYLLPTRGWEMLLGGLAYFTRPKLNKIQLNILSGVGCILIIMSCFYISKDDVWPGYLALIPAFGVFLILIGNSDFFVLNNKFVQTIGTYSYSIYLWHWIVVFMAYRYTDMNMLVIFMGVGLSFILGLLSYEIIEKRGFNRTNKLLISTSFLLTFIFYSLFDEIILHRDISNTENNELVEYYEHKENTSAPWIENICANKIECVKGGVFLWGDSHAHALYYGLKNANVENISTLTTSGCAPSLTYPAYKLRSRITCNRNNRDAIEHIKLKRPVTVILARRFKHEETDWNLIASKLKDLGVIEVIVLGPVPQFKGSLPLLVANKYMHENLVKRIDIEESIFRSNERMKSVENKNYTYIDVLGGLCSEDGCLFKSEFGNNHKLISFDYGHLSTDGSTFVVNSFIINKL